MTTHTYLLFRVRIVGYKPKLTAKTRDLAMNCNCIVNLVRNYPKYMQEINSFKTASDRAYHSEGTIIFTSPVSINRQSLITEVLHQLNSSSGYYIASANPKLYNPIWVNITSEFSSIYVKNDECSKELIFIVLLYNGNNPTWDDIKNNNIWNVKLLSMVTYNKNNFSYPNVATANIKLTPYNIVENL